MPKNNKDFETFDKRFWIIISIFLILVLSVCFILPQIIIGPAKFGILFNENTGVIGDTIGGILGPAIAVIVAGLTFLAFWVQYKANTQQKQQFEEQLQEQRNQFASQIKLQEQLNVDQDRIWRIERFEDRFYELLKIHISNTLALTLADKYKAKKVFQKLFQEYKGLYECVFSHIHVHCKGWNRASFGFDKNNREMIGNISYLVYFWGVEKFSDKILIESMTKSTSTQYCTSLIKYLTERKETWRTQKDINGHCKIEFNTSSNGSSFSVNFNYIPCDGHWQRLGTYYRHLFQTIKFVAEYNLEIIPVKAKYEYTKLIRAQLSNYEQLMLYYNSCSNLGKDWNNVENNFIVRFKLIKNIPVPLADFGLSPKDKFADAIVESKKSGKLFFEWDE